MKALRTMSVARKIQVMMFLGATGLLIIPYVVWSACNHVSGPTCWPNQCGALGPGTINVNSEGNIQLSNPTSEPCTSVWYLADYVWEIGDPLKLKSMGTAGGNWTLPAFAPAQWKTFGPASASVYVESGKTYLHVASGEVDGVQNKQSCQITPP